MSFFVSPSPMIGIMLPKTQEPTDMGFLRFGGWVFLLGFLIY